MDLKTKTQRKRTEKVFEEYNDYHDRPFGLKWGTTFRIDELNKVIEDNKARENRVSIELNQMSREEIDEVLQVAFTKSLRVSIQLNQKDEYNHYVDNIEGLFHGFADYEYLYINDRPIEWSLIRNIKVMKKD